MSRTVWHVVYRNLDDRWHVELESRTIADFANKAEAMADGQRRGNKLEANGQTAQLVIHGVDGTIQMEYTYGNDPRRTKG